MPSSPATIRLALTLMPPERISANRSTGAASSLSPTMAVPMLGVKPSLAPSSLYLRTSASASGRFIPLVYFGNG